MFLTERIISLLTYAFALFIACTLMSIVARKQWKFILCLYLAVLCVFAYFYQPYITADLYRLREYVQFWINIPWSQLLNTALGYSTPAWIVYSYLLNKTGDINMLQTVTCLWCFSNVFYIIGREIEYENIRGKRKGLLLFYVMAVGALFLQTISGIRTMLGISIVAFCFYRETVEKKSIFPHIALYLFAALLHSAAMVLVIVRLSLVAVQYKERAKKIMMSLVVITLGLFSFYYLKDYINQAFEMGQGYLLNKSEYTYIWEIIIGAIENLETVILLVYYRKFIKDSTDKSLEGYNKIWSLCMLWTIISISALPFSYTIFRRYTIFCTVLGIPLLGKTIDKEQKTKKTNVLQIILIISFIIFGLSGVRGDLCGYKFFVL